MIAKALAVAAALSLVPALALAQSDPAAQLPATPQAPAMGADVGAAADFDMFLQGFGAADYTSAANSIDTATTFNIVKISSLANADATRLQEAIGPHQADIASLSTKIEANTTAKAALDAQGLSAANVVWVETGADGAVTLYVNDL
jgi:hypothetical protein